MKGFIRNNRILFTAMGLVLIVCFIVIGSRFSVEKKNNVYDIVLDYNEIAAMAKQSEHDVSWWLSEFKSMGITKVGLAEESFSSLMENEPEVNLTADLVGNITREANWKDQYPVELVSLFSERGYDPYDLVVQMQGAETVAFVLDALKTRFTADKYIIVDQGDIAYVLIDGAPNMALFSPQYKYTDSKTRGFIERADKEASKIMYISLGLLPDKVETIQGLGMEIIPRTSSYNGWNDSQYGKAVMDGYAKYGIVPEYIIVGGEAVFGYDDGAELAKDYILNSGITIGLIENTTQLSNIMQYGVENVAIESGYDTVRVFSVWNYIQYRYQYYPGYVGAEEIENTLFRAVTERNMRVIYFKPFLENNDRYTYVTNADEYSQMFANLEERLEEHDLHFGTASVMENYQVPTAFKILFGIGAVIGAVLLLRSFMPVSRKLSLILAAIGAICVPAAFYIMPNTAELIAALASCIVFGCLAATFFTASAKRCMDRLDKNAGLFPILKVSVLTLVISVFLALLGGLMTAAPISSVDYMLEIGIFRGVKVGQLLPIAYFIVAYLAYFGYGARKSVPGNLEFHDIKDLLNANIKVWMIFLAAVVGGVGVYYIMRTGHDSSVEVSNMEMLFRNTLEEMLIARPRSKEFLFAFPAIMMMVYCAVRRFKLWSILFGMGGVIGVTSVINTFEHIRTPLYLGFIRTGYSLIFGIIIGVVGMIIFEGFYRLYNTFLRKYVEADGLGADG